MQRPTGLLAAALIVLTTFSQFSCKNGQEPPKNANKEPPQKNGHWMPQYRFPASVNLTGTNLAVYSFNAISVVSKDVVFVSGDYPDPVDKMKRVEVVLRTTDGGKAWKELPVDPGGKVRPSLNAIHFLDANNGWAAGFDEADRGLVLKTTDGGASWTTTMLSFKQSPTSICFINPSRGWIGGFAAHSAQEETLGGPSDILTTNDGGTTWTSAYHLPVSVTAMHFADDKNGWAACNPPSVYRTADGGRTWQSQSTGLEQAGLGLTGISFLDPQKGWASSGLIAEDKDAGAVIGTTDGGASWATMWLSSGEKILDIYFANPAEGWAVTNKGRYVYHSTDGGQHWGVEPIDFPENLAVYRIRGADADHVWAVGGGAIFYRTE